MAKKSYQEYLLSTTWQKKRKMALDHYGRECVLCGSNKNLEVHHRHYKSGWGNEKVEDLIVLCSSHHQMFEEMKKRKLSIPDLMIVDIQKQLILEAPQAFVENCLAHIILVWDTCGFNGNIRNDILNLWSRIMEELKRVTHG